MSKQYQKLDLDFDEETGDVKKVMSGSKKQYQKLDSDEIEMNIKSSECSDINDKSSEMKIPDNGFAIKILLKEQCLHLNGLFDQTTIGQLKIEVEKLTNVAVSSQRLIFSGKPLKIDEKTLKDYNIVESSSVHLFPIPVKDPSAVATEVITSTVNPINALIQPSSSSYAIEIQHPINFDPEISQHCREVKLWSILLLFLSSMTLFNNFSYFFSTGKIGNNTLDSTVTIMDTLCSAAGIYVAQIGLNAARTIDLDSIRKYLRWLTVLAVACILMRIAWIFDIILQIQDAVNKAKNNPTDGTDTGTTDPDNTSNTPGIGTTNGQVLDQKLVNSYAAQACVIGLICLGAWINCVHRGRLLRNSVQIYTEATAV